jgi:hypothetical protein
MREFKTVECKEWETSPIECYYDIRHHLVVILFECYLLMCNIYRVEFVSDLDVYL